MLIVLHFNAQGRGVVRRVQRDTPFIAEMTRLIFGCAL
jgi:hypothetical protein